MSVLSLKDHKNGSPKGNVNICDSVLTLPVAPQIVARTRFSPPTSTKSHCLVVPEAMQWLENIMAARGDSISMIVIHGPGDPLATPEITLETIYEIRKRFTKTEIGIRTLGIGSGKIAADLAKAGANTIGIEVNGVRAEILEKLYAWIRPGQKTLKISNAAELLLKEQQNGVPTLKFHELSVSILTTLYPGYNIDHVSKISNEMMELGADTISLEPYSPEPDAEVSLEEPSEKIVKKATKKAAQYLSVSQSLFHACADNSCGSPAEKLDNLPKPTQDKPRVAVASSDGYDINLHLGQAGKFLIYGPREDGLPCLLETRQAPQPGSSNRWGQLASVLSDCFALLVASAGETPQKSLRESGIKVLVTEENIAGTVDVLYGGKKKKKGARK